MATKSFSSREIDRLFKQTVITMLILGSGVLAVGVGAFTDFAIATWAGYVLLAISIGLLAWISRPVFK